MEVFPEARAPGHRSGPSGTTIISPANPASAGQTWGHIAVISRRTLRRNTASLVMETRIPISLEDWLAICESIYSCHDPEGECPNNMPLLRAPWASLALWGSFSAIIAIRDRFPNPISPFFSLSHAISYPLSPRLRYSLQQLERGRNEPKPVRTY